MRFVDEHETGGNFNTVRHTVICIKCKRFFLLYCTVFQLKERNSQLIRRNPKIKLELKSFKISCHIDCTLHTV